MIAKANFRVEKSSINILSLHPELGSLSGEVEAALPWQTNLQTHLDWKAARASSHRPNSHAPGLSQFTFPLTPRSREACLERPPRAQPTHLTPSLGIKDVEKG